MKSALVMLCVVHACISAGIARADPAPLLEGLQFDEASELAAKGGFELETKPERSLERIGKVIMQIPAEGSDVRTPKRLFVKVSKGIELPNLVGLSKAEAEATMAALGVGVESSARRHDGLVRGQVADQMPPAGANLDASAEVVFLDVVGGHYVPVPDVHGRPLSEALDLIRQGELTAGETPSASDFASTSGRVTRNDCRTVTKSTATASSSLPPAGTEVYPGTSVSLSYDVNSVVVTDNICPPPPPRDRWGGCCRNFSCC